jgi:hypothetical protein
MKNACDTISPWQVLISTVGGYASKRKGMPPPVLYEQLEDGSFIPWARDFPQVQVYAEWPTTQTKAQAEAQSPLMARSSRPSSHHRDEELEAFCKEHGKPLTTFWPRGYKTLEKAMAAIIRSGVVELTRD